MQDDPYFTNPSGYGGRHRDDSAQARADAVRADFAYLTQQPSRHHHGAHSAYTRTWVAA